MASKRGRSKKRQHTYRGAQSKPGLMFTGSHRCRECGKWCYPSRYFCEAAVRVIHPGATVHYYRCQDSPEHWWHFTSMTAEQVTEIREREAHAGPDCPEETAV